MLNNYQKKLVIIKKIALEYRLSLKNICRLLSIEPTVQNQKNIYDELIMISTDYNDVVKLNFLFNETESENENESNRAYNLANFFFRRYLYALSTGRQDLIDNSYQKFFQTDINFKNLLKKGISGNITDEEFMIISKFRVKHVLSKTVMQKRYGISIERITRIEKRISNDRFKRKIEFLNDYFFSVGFRNKTKGYNL